MKLVAVLAASLLVSACAVPASESDEPAMQAAAILFMRQQRADETSIVRTDSITPSFLASASDDNLAFFAPDASAQTLASFRARAAVIAPLTDDAFPPGSVISPVPEPAPQENASVVGVSRAGLGVDEGLVYIALRCGDGCAEEHLLFLRRDGDGWRVVSSERLSVA